MPTLSANFYPGEKFTKNAAAAENDVFNRDYITDVMGLKRRIWEGVGPQP